MESYVLNKFLSVTYRSARRHVSKYVKDFNLSSTQADILLYLADNPGINQKNLAFSMVLDPSLIGRDVTKLELKEFIIREIDLQDTRSRILKISKKGMEVVETLRRELTLWWDESLKKSINISAEEFIQTMNDLYENTRQK